MANAYEIMKTSPQQRKRAGAWVRCETCERVFYVMPARVKQVASNGHVIRYCSKQCYVKTGDKNPFWGKKHSAETKQKFVDNPAWVANLIGNRPNPNIARFGHVSGYKTRSQRLRSQFSACQICGWDKQKEVLELHHIDHNPLNNKPENVQLICPNCHSTEHFKLRTGKYTNLGKKKAKA